MCGDYGIAHGLLFLTLCYPDPLGSVNKSDRNSWTSQAHYRISLMQKPHSQECLGSTVVPLCDQVVPVCPIKMLVTGK